MAASAAAVRTPEVRAKLSAIGKARMADPANRAAISSAVSQLWKDGAYAAQAAATRTTSAYRDRQARNARAAWQDPEITERRVAAIKAALADPEACARISAGRRAAMNVPGTRERMQAAAKATQARPDVRAKIAATRIERAARRARAKGLIVSAGRAPWRRLVDRVVAMLAAGAPPGAVIATLRAEAA
jgi:hypothetical protein